MWNRWMLRLAGVSSVILQYGCIAHCTFEFVGDFVMCSGPSMQPNINPSDIVLTERYSIFSKEISMGDIVIARSPTNPKQYVCKRVAGVEGDWIRDPPTGFSRKHVPRGHVWLEGDNKENSTDSRVYGPVPYGLLRGRVFFKVWPMKDFGYVPGDEPVSR